MSMTFAQCDELRKTADELQGFMDNAHNYTRSGFSSTLHYAQQKLRGAADTIWELRCKLAGVVDQQDEIERLKVENAKLRELCKDIWNDACHFDEFWDYVHDDGTIYREDELPHYQERMCELGIEVY